MRFFLQYLIKCMQFRWKVISSMLLLFVMVIHRWDIFLVFRFSRWKRLQGVSQLIWLKGIYLKLLSHETLSRGESVRFLWLKGNYEVRSEGTPRYDTCRQCEKGFNTNYKGKKHHVWTHAVRAVFVTKDLTQSTMWRNIKWQYIHERKS